MQWKKSSLNGSSVRSLEHFSVEDLIKSSLILNKDLKNTSKNPDTWELLADSRPAWRHAVRQGTLQQEAHCIERAAQERAKRKQRTEQPQQPSVLCQMYISPGDGNYHILASKTK
ncbi:hypothetical protein RRG08_002221 [Elysia crispata]|uniref:Uncharacterized protein n=1 Tax=Elysia crispata TaxID=231223 RepID=A0AAE0ZAY7_9GAST|nr:hypothetical protein RRG08_002221 [Elysia crispata]